MQTAAPTTTRARRMGILCAVASVLASFASLYAFSGYVHWHEQLRRFGTGQESPPDWLTWSFVDRWKAANVILDCAALALATLATVRRAQPLAAMAVILALVVCIATVPLVT